MQAKRGICGLCSAGCWVIAQYGSDGRITLLKPDKDTPMGILCRLGEHAADIIYSKDRLLYPMRRKGAKGTFSVRSASKRGNGNDGDNTDPYRDFERISWQDAYAEITDRLNTQKEKYGPEAAAIYTGVGSFEQSLCDIFQPAGVAISSASSVLFPYGSPNTMGVGALCYVSYGMIAPHLCTGKMLKDMYNDMDSSEMIVVWGTNPATDQPPVDMKRILSAHERGASIVVIDPRRTQAARLEGAQWIPIRPGTDGALALGLCNILIEEELYDEKFVQDWTHGFEEFSRYVQHFRAEVVESITGIPRETIVKLARELAEARGASQLMYTGLEYSTSGVQAIRASLVLWALAGQLDVPGGRCFTMPGNSFPINRAGLIPNPDTGVRLGRDRFPVYVHYRDEAHAIALPEAVLENKIRSLIIQGGSILTSWPQTDIWQRTLGGLEFVVCIDRQLTADAAYADILLPASTYFETDSYMTYGPIFRVRERMIEPLGQSRSDYRIMSELAEHLGYGHLYPQGHGQVLSHVLEGSGFSVEDVGKAGGQVWVETRMQEYRKWEKGLLRTDGAPGFDTPSGKFEIHSDLLEEFGYDALPVYTEPAEGPLSSPHMLDEYPLIFNSGSRSSGSFHTQHIGNEALNAERPAPGVLINTKDAQARGIKNGERVRISTARGSVVMRAKVTDNIMPGTIDANHAGGGPLAPDEWREANINRLTDLGQYDPISGFPVYKSLLCQVELVHEGGDALVMRERDEVISVPANGGNGGNGGSKREVYLDNNATTALALAVREFMRQCDSTFGNASSIHGRGRESAKIIAGARRTLADALGTTARRIVFTGSGSEANNMAIKGVAFTHGLKQTHIITSMIEHPSVLETCRWIEREGARVTYLPVDSSGMVNPHDLKNALTSSTTLVSIMLANNEVGTIQPIAELTRMAHAAGALMHVDAVQGFGKIVFKVGELGVDLLSISAHKIHGPKGVGALYRGRTVNMESLVHGGGQEHGARSGTENVTAIAGFGKAVELAGPDEAAGISALRDKLEAGLRELVPDLIINGHKEKRLPGTLNVTLPGMRGESIVLALDRYGVYLSSGSACKSGSSAPSHVLLAMGIDEAGAHCSLRFSLGTETTRKDIGHTIESLRQVIVNAKESVHFIPCR